MPIQKRRSIRTTIHRVSPRTALVTMLMLGPAVWVLLAQTESAVAQAQDATPQKSPSAAKRKVKAKAQVKAEKAAVQASPSANAVASPAVAAKAAEIDVPVDTVAVQSRRNVLGTAVTASQGSVTQQELNLRPVYRVGQLLESVPGLVVTIHSGEGKANQFIIRGFNLDHGTDFATFIDDIPYNEPTHAHGQGYTLLNSFIPELANGLDYTKGPFYPAVGDFAGLGSAHIKLADAVPNQISASAGTLGDERVYLGGTSYLGNGDRLTGVGAISHLDGPWAHPDNYRGLNGAVRYAHGTVSDGFDITAQAFRSQSSNTTDQPVSAYQDGLIGRFGTLDPTDGAFNQRLSLAGHDYLSGDNWKLTTNAYAVSSRLTLWNDFTHFLVDPVNGDQEQQDESRITLGGGTTYTRVDTVAGFATETQLGLQGRYDTEYIDRRHTRARVVLAACPDNLGGGGLYVCNADKVQLGNVAGYVQNTTHWLPWLRTFVGLRDDYYAGDDDDLITGFHGHTAKVALQPKGSLILGPWNKTEFYVSGGRGYHSNDLRGVVGTVPALGVSSDIQGTPFLTKITSEEVGLRTDVIPRTRLTAAVFQVDFASFLTYDADNGVDDAGPPARLRGVEISDQYKPASWIELNGDINFTHSRYFTGNIANYGLPGLYLPNSPGFIGSFGAIVDNLGHWYGGAQFRWLGGYPLVEDNSLRSSGYKELNFDVGYKITPHAKLLLSIFNVTNSHANASQYAYQYQSTPTSAPEFGATYHPLEPLSARFELIATF